MTGLWRLAVSFGFRLLYNELAWAYDFVSQVVSLGRWRTWQRAVFPYITGPRILEVAFGTGNLLLDLSERGYECYGIDLSPHMLRIAKGKLSRKGMNVHLCRAKAQGLPFRAGTFDSAVITFPTAFIRDPDSVYELGRVLRPEGSLVVVEGAELLKQNVLFRFINFLYVITGQREPLPDMTEAFRKAGLEAHWEEEPAPDSKVRLLIAIKS